MEKSKYTEGDEEDLLGFEEIGVHIEQFRSALLPKKDKKDYEEFEEYFGSLKAIYFKAYELAYLGSSHYGSGTCASMNNLADQGLWTNLNQLVPVLDAVREDLGYPIRLTSVHRNDVYNCCVGGVADSQHLLLKAADCVVKDVDNLQLYQSVVNIRRSGLFAGGVGLYGSFVHVDVRGENIDWVGSSAFA